MRSTDDDQRLALAKRALRARVKELLGKMIFDRARVAERLYSQLNSIERFRCAKTIGLFVDFQNEVPTKELVPLLFDDLMGAMRRDRVLAVPFCDHSEMTFYRLPVERVASCAPFDFRAFLPFFEISRYGVLEPSEEWRADQTARVDPQALDLMLAPGLAFDLDGGRLGRGAGFYDRYLPQMRVDALVLGLAFDEQIVERVPRNERDFKVDGVVTPTRALLTSRK